MSKGRSRPFVHMVNIVNTSRSQIDLLTAILHQEPDEPVEHYHKRISNLLPALPSRFRRSNRIVKLFRQLSSHQPATLTLCNVHSQLNEQALLSILQLVKLEVGPRLEGLLEVDRDIIPAELWETVIAPLGVLPKLWTHPSTTSHQHSSHNSNVIHKFYIEPWNLSFENLSMINWNHHINGCAACILADIINDPKTLCALRCTVMSRETAEYTERYGEPRLKAWVDAWLISKVRRYRTDGDDEAEQLAFHLAIASGVERTKDLMELRRQVRNERSSRIEISKGAEPTRLFSGPSPNNKKSDIHPATFFIQRQFSETDCPSRYPAEFGAVLTEEEYLRYLSEQIHLRKTTGSDAYLSDLSEPVAAFICAQNRSRHASIDRKYSASEYSIDTIRNNERVIGDNTYSILLQSAPCPPQHASTLEVIAEEEYDFDRQGAQGSDDDEEFRYLEGGKEEEEDFESSDSEMVVIGLPADEYRDHRRQERQITNRIDPPAPPDEPADKASLSELVLGREGWRWSDVYRSIGTAELQESSVMGVRDVKTQMGDQASWI